jgi:hypothetical protein
MRTGQSRRHRVVAEIVLAALVAVLGPSVPAHAGAQPDPFFGTWSDGLSLTRADSQRELDRQAGSGVGLIRQYIWWDRIERSPGVFDWARMDELVADASARGMQILPTLLYTPAFYSSKPAGSASTAQFPPSDPGSLERFAEAMVNRYGTEGDYWCQPPLFPGMPMRCPSSYTPITFWEVWNEPDHPSWWKGSPDPAEYLALLKPVSAAIHRADAAAKVVLGSQTNVGGGTRGAFLDRLYALGGREHFDVLSINPYARDVGGLIAYLRGLRDIAASHGDAAKPVYVTEYGWATGGRSAVIVTDRACQGALIHAAASRLRELRTELKIQAVAQFQWHDVRTTSTAWPHYAGVIDVDDQAKPGLSGFQAAIAWQPAPAGLGLAEACPGDRRSLDGRLQPLTVTKTGTGAGVVQSSPAGIKCGTVCTQQVSPGTVVTLTAVPDQRSIHSGWRGAKCAGLTCTVTMSQARNVQASFTRVATAGVHEQNTRYVTRSGSWAGLRSARDSGGSSMSATRSASVGLTFKGTGISWVSRKSRKNGIARVYLDGRAIRMVDGYSRKPLHRMTMLSIGGLRFGRHDLRIDYTGLKRKAARNNNIVLDAFVVR